MANRADVESPIEVRVELLDKIYSINRYESCHWDVEHAVRFVFQVEDSVVEASTFLHFMGDTFIKSAIELPLSSGCPIGCKHCASGAIQKVRPLGSIEITHLFDQLIQTVPEQNRSPLRVSYTGTGEASLYRRSLEDSARIIHEEWPKATFTIATLGLLPEFLCFCRGLSLTLPVNVLQVTYLHWDRKRVHDVVPLSQNGTPDVASLRGELLAMTGVRVRINYVVICGFNDSDSDCRKLLKLLDGLQKVISIRISRLNETSCSRKYGLKPVSIRRLRVLQAMARNAGFHSYVFASHINDNMNCGQLAWSYGEKPGTVTY